MTRYSLTSHTFVCVTDGCSVFLDLRRNKYLALDATETRTLAEVVDGWPPVVNASSDEAPEARTSAAALADSLIQSGLLEEATPSSKNAQRHSAVVPTSSCRPAFATRPPLRIRDVTRFLLACAYAWLTLRFCSLEYTVRRVGKRRARKSASAPATSEETMRGLVTQFRFLSPFVFTSDNACLLDSLALIEFMARNGVYPAWVFGVRMTPFAAHCWVQHGATVLNGSVKATRAYAPIMAI